MKTYTEEELLKAIKYACEYQKATDYQTAGQLLVANIVTTEDDVIKLLDELADSDNTAVTEIELKDIFQ